MEAYRIVALYWVVVYYFKKIARDETFGGVKNN